jgi:hypothetical protein
VSFLLGLIALIVGLMFAAGVLHISVAVVGGDKVSDKNTCGTAVGVVLMLNLLGLVLGLIPFLGFPLFVIAWFVVIMGAYDIGFGRALLVAIVNLAISVVIQLILVAVGIGAFGVLAMLRGFGF